jgi:maltose O-acetyltransferase
VLPRWERRRIAHDIVVNRVAGSVLTPNAVRWRLLRRVGMEIDKCLVNPGVVIESRDLAIGRDSFVNSGCWLDNSQARITIGRDVAFGQRVLVTTSSHDASDPAHRAGRNLGAPVTIGDGCWIGAQSVILPGVTVGAGCIVAAGAVVTRDCTPHGLYAGVPARRVRDLDA